VLGYLLDDRSEALTTRGDDENFFEAAGRRYHSLLDPRTGAPARGLRAVTVVAIDGPAAAAAAQALFVAGPDHWRELARKLGIEQAMAVSESGEISATQALHDRLKLLHDAQARVLP
jgi:thiamine biosynthesis lipoprotein